MTTKLEPIEHEGIMFNRWRNVGQSTMGCQCYGDCSCEPTVKNWDYILYQWVDLEGKNRPIPASIESAYQQYLALKK